MQWSLNSFTVAVKEAHLDGAIGNLQGFTDENNPPSLPDGYTANKKAVSEERATLGGYRVAQTLKMIEGSK